MPTCPKCNADVDHLHAFVEETNKYEIELEECRHSVPKPLRGKANVCLAGGPKTEDYPGGQFCSYLETVGTCKLEGDYQGLNWGSPEAMEGSGKHTDFNCPECDHTLFSFEGEDSSHYTVVEEFLKGKVKA